MCPNPYIGASWSDEYSPGSGPLERSLGANCGQTNTLWFQKLDTAYSEPHRAYHNSTHIRECLSELDSCKHSENADLIELALWFHDAVYDPRRGDNEEQSAALTAECMEESGLAADGPKIRELILATKSHDCPGDLDAALLIDIDLSILGREEQRFSEYESAIREEYSWVPLQLYVSKRIEVLRGFLDRSAIYNTPQFRERFENQARKNIQAAISNLLSQ